MPEGHTIHRHARHQRRLLVGKKLRVSSPQGRFEDAAVFDGRKLKSIEPHGKHLLYHFTTGTLHVHLGMYGRYWFRRPGGVSTDDEATLPGAEDAGITELPYGYEPSKAPTDEQVQRDTKADLTLPEPTPTTRLRLATKSLAVDLTGPTACELYSPEQIRKLMDRLGPDPLKDPDAGDAVWERLHKSKAPIGTLIMDQSVMGRRRQRLPQRAALPRPPRPPHPRNSNHPRAVGRALARHRRPAQRRRQAQAHPLCRPVVLRQIQLASARPG